METLRCVCIGSAFVTITSLCEKCYEEWHNFHYNRSYKFFEWKDMKLKEFRIKQSINVWAKNA